MSRAERDRALLGGTMIETSYGPIEYSTLGKGSPILIIHGTGGGGPGDLRNSRRRPVRLSTHCAVTLRLLENAVAVRSLTPARSRCPGSIARPLDIDRAAVMSFSAGTAPPSSWRFAPSRVSSLVLFVPAAGGMYAPIGNGPPPFVMNVVLRYDFPMWLTMKLSPNTIYKVAAVPSSLVPTLQTKIGRRSTKACACSCR